ncbi:HPP family protein [Thermodesulfobacteriota bacterium]
MEIKKAIDLMVPLEEYATVFEEATLKGAVDALEKAQEELDRKRYKYLHRAILVLNKNKKVVGKISQMDILIGLEPKYKDIGDTRRVSLSGFSPQFLTSMMNSHNLWSSRLKNICTKAANTKVKDIMVELTDGEFIDEKTSLEEAMHIMIIGHHHSLLVNQDRNIMGILRLADVFNYINDLIKVCEI